MVGILKWWFAGLGDVPMTYFTTKGVPWLTHCNLLVSSSSPLGTGKQATYLRSLLWNQSFYLYVFVKTLHYGYIWFFQDVASDCFFSKGAVPFLEDISPLRGAIVFAQSCNATLVRCDDSTRSIPVGSLDSTLLMENHHRSLRYPLVMTNIAIENGHRNSGFTHWKWWFSIAMLVYQRVKLPEGSRG
jgi:hypothetical protein